jgi:type I restriction enzyme S subunit
MSDWKTESLDECLETLLDYRGKSPPKSAQGIPVLSAKVVKTTGLLRPIEQKIATDYYSKWMVRGLPRVGDVVMTTEAPMGEVIQLDSETVHYALGQRIVCMRGKSQKLDNTFLRYLLASPAQQAILASYATGTTVLGISQKSLRSVPITYPDFDEQIHIGKLLGALDDKIELNRRMNETLEAMARAIFKDWFIDFGPIRAKIEDRAPYLEANIWSLFPDALDENGLPKGWGELCVEDIMELAYGKALKASERVTGSIPVYGSGGIIGYHNKAMVSGPAIIVGRKGTVGSLYWEDRSFFPIDTVFYVKPKAPLTFCFYHLQTLGLEGRSKPQQCISAASTAERGRTTQPI